jgi:hypothetical protein
MHKLTATRRSVSPRRTSVAIADHEPDEATCRRARDRVRQRFVNHIDPKQLGSAAEIFAAIADSKGPADGREANEGT